MSEKKRLLITAGPTHEPIDDVRFVGNRSSGRLGLALAATAASRGWPVTLLLGPVGPIEVPAGVAMRRFVTAAELEALLAELWPEHDVLIMAAAVADYRPARMAPGTKLRRGDGPLVLELEPTPDLLAATASASRPDQTLIGFALEPQERFERSARDKLARKKVHAIVANALETIGAPTITARVYLADGRTLEPPAGMEKDAFAEWMVEEVLSLES